MKKDLHNYLEKCHDKPSYTRKKYHNTFRHWSYLLRSYTNISKGSLLTTDLRKLPKTRTQILGSRLARRGTNKNLFTDVRANKKVPFATRVTILRVKSILSSFNSTFLCVLCGLDALVSNGFLTICSAPEKVTHCPTWASNEMLRKAIK